jgi:hypothetical protein
MNTTDFEYLNIDNNECIRDKETNYIFISDGYYQGYPAFTIYRQKSILYLYLTNDKKIQEIKIPAKNNKRMREDNENIPELKRIKLF